jgi:hypothetical protein
MVGDAELEVYRALRENQSSGTYYLLTAAGAAIALAVNQTHGLKLSWSQMPLAFAVICWGASFFFGCRYLNWTGATLYANAEFLRVTRGGHPDATTPEVVGIAREGIRKAAEQNSNSGQRCALWQFRLLVWGGGLYVVWHVLEMYLRTVRT